MSILETIIAAIHSLVGGPMPRAAVEAKLAEKAAAWLAAHHERLDWRHSIVDLLKLIGQDSSLQAREALAASLGYTGAYNGSAEMNIWLIGKVLDELARSGTTES